MEKKGLIKSSNNLSEKELMKLIQNDEKLQKYIEDKK